MEQHPDIYQRINEKVDAAHLLTQEVVVFGAGRAGATIGQHCMRWPLRKITYIDHDVVEAKDLGNLYASYFHGQPKVYSMSALTKAWNPAIEVDAHVFKITRHNLKKLREIVSDSHLLFLALDDTEVFEPIVQEFHRDKIIVATMATEEGAFGLIAWSVPGQTACVECCLNVSQARQGQGRPSLPCDLDLIQNIAVQVALGLLLVGKGGYELLAPLLHPDYNLILVYNRENANNISRSFDVPKGTQLLKVNSSCSICSPGRRQGR